MQVRVDMMNMEDLFDVYIDKSINTSVLYLPFNSSSSMLLLLPDDMATLENAISPGNVTKWLKWKKSKLRGLWLEMLRQTNYGYKALHRLSLTFHLSGHTTSTFQSSPSSPPTS